MMKDFFIKMFNCFKIGFFGIFNFFKKYISMILSGIKNSFNRCTKGEEKLNKMLWFWCIIPNIFFISKYFAFFYQFTIVKILVILYSGMCFYFILKAIEVHPEYNVSEVKRKEELEYINSLDEEELREYIKNKNNDKIKDFFKKALLQKAWHTKEFYKITEIFLLFIFMFTMLKLF